MYSLYPPSSITQFVSTVIFYIVITSLIGGAGYIYFQQKRITSLESSLAEYKATAQSAEHTQNFLEKNIEVLKRNCKRKIKPVVVEGRLEMENLFNVPPR